MELNDTAADRYIALALQLRCDAVNGLEREDARLRMMASIERIGRQIDRCKALLGPELRLVVLPEYGLTGFPLGDSIPSWASKAGISEEGPEVTALAGIAVRNDLFLSFNAYVVDPHFQGLYFQACLVIGPSGALVLRYRRLISLYAPSPYDVWDAYLDRYGADAVFPVADTAIGRLGAIASEEILYPEIARILALKGAEVLLHNSAEFGSSIASPKEICRIARAAENGCFVVSANSAGLIDAGDIPAASTDGMSKIVDMRGLVIAAAGNGESMAANGDVDLAMVRHLRRRPGMSNYLSRVPAEAVCVAYGTVESPRQNGLLGPGGRVVVPDRDWFRARQAKVIDLRSQAAGSHSQSQSLTPFLREPT